MREETKLMTHLPPCLDHSSFPRVAHLATRLFTACLLSFVGFGTRSPLAITEAWRRAVYVISERQAGFPGMLSGLDADRAISQALLNILLKQTLFMFGRRTIPHCLLSLRSHKNYTFNFCLYIYYQTYYLYDLILFLALFVDLHPPCLYHEPRKRKISY